MRGVRIEDYAMIGDCRTAALVSRHGSIDWFCCPRFDSAASFAALLGTSDNGRWLIAPRGKAKITRRYRKNGLILETTFETKTGTVELIDFMPMGTEHSTIVRLVTGKRGTVEMHTDLTVRFDYGVSIPWVSRADKETLTAVAGPNRMVLRTPVAVRGHDMRSEASFTVSKGETVPFVMSYGPSFHDMPPPLNVETALGETELFWEKWSAIGKIKGKWAPAVQRSLVTLKGLTYSPTGGMVAAATTSLPEEIGGVRNWDYRYCWLRDATFTLLAFMNAGYREEATVWQHWLMRAIAGSPQQMQTMYGVVSMSVGWMNGRLPWLAGYQGSRPVRVGNAAATQLQLDIYGELADVMSQATKGGLEPAPRRAELQREVFLAHLETIWKKKDEGICRKSGAIPAALRAFQGDGLGCVFDRAANGGTDKTHKHWRKIANKIHADICKKGVDKKRGCFVQSYGSKKMDASLLMLAIVGFLPASDPRMQGHGRGDRAHAAAQGLCHALRDRLGRRWAAWRRRRVSGLQLLARGQLHSWRPLRRGRGAVRQAGEACQRCRSACGRIRSARQAHARQFPAGLFACGAGEHGPQPDPCEIAEDHRRDPDPAPSQGPETHEGTSRMTAVRRILSIDIGGTGLKAAVIDAKGRMISHRVRVPIRRRIMAGPKQTVKMLTEMAKKLTPFDHIAIGFPGVVRKGRVLTAHNLGTEKWKDFPLAQTLSRALHAPARMINDADMQGLAVVRGERRRDGCHPRHRHRHSVVSGRCARAAYGAGASPATRQQNL